MTTLNRIGPLLVALSVAAPAQAANLDKALLDNTPDLLVGLKKADIKSVGVLPFTVKRGTRAAAFDAAPLSSGLPTRLENAMLLRQSSNEAKAMKVVRDASGTAAKARVGAWTKNQAAFEKLFATKYELAWGDARLPVDAFLTGEVRLTGDRKEAVVVVRYLKADSWMGGRPVMTDLGTFKVKTDRSLLRDLGYNAVVSRALRRPGSRATADELDNDVIDQVFDEEEGKKPVPDVKQPESHSPENIAGMRLEIEYDGVKQEVRSEAGGNGALQPSYTVAAPKPGQKVVMYVTRTAEGDHKLGVVLRVNGKSTWEEEDLAPANCRRWVFDAASVGKREDFAGYYRRGEDGKLVCNEWKSLDESEAAERAAEVGNRAGWIDLDVFGSRDPGAVKDEGLLISTRSMSKGKKKPATLRDLRVQLAKANFMALSPIAARSMGGLLIGDVNAVPAGEVTKDSLGNVAHLGGISIRYLPPAEGDGKTVDD